MQTNVFTYNETEPLQSKRLLTSGLYVRRLKVFILTVGLKAEQTEKSTTLICQRSWVTGQITAPQTGETDGSTENHNLTEHKLKSRNLHRDQCQDRQTWTIVDKLLEAKCGQAWKRKTAEGPSHREALIPLYFTFRSSKRVLIVNIRKKNPLSFQEGRERERVLKYVTALLPSKQGLPSEEIILPEHKLLGWCQMLGGRREIPNSNPF